MKQNYLLLLICIAIHSCNSIEKEDEHKSLPNIILIYVEDMGYSDIVIYGEEFGNIFFETHHSADLKGNGSEEIIAGTALGHLLDS